MFNSTTDVEVCHLPSVDRMLVPLLRGYIFPAIAEMYDLKPEWLLLRELFLVRYSSAGQTELSTHIDQSFLSFIVQLSQPTEVIGGGTQFEILESPLSVPSGSSVGACIRTANYLLRSKSHSWQPYHSPPIPFNARH